MKSERHARRRATPGFSLLELLAVVTLIGIIAAVVLPRISGHALNGKVKVCYQFKADLNSALERYFFNTGSFAATLAEIENNDDYYPDIVPACPVDGAAYTIDPVTHRIQGHAH